MTCKETGKCDPDSGGEKSSQQKVTLWGPIDLLCFGQAKTSRSHMLKDKRKKKMFKELKANIKTVTP